MAREPVGALVELADPRYHLSHISHTFHGRDVFAAAAAHLAVGVSITDLGPSVTEPVVFPLPRLEVVSGSIVGEVLHVDRFGNVVTSIGQLLWGGDGLSLDPAFGDTEVRAQCDAAEATVVVAGQEIAGVRRTYAEVDPGEMLALVGSSGHLEVAVRKGSAAQWLGVRPGDEVVLRV